MAGLWAAGRLPRLEGWFQRVRQRPTFHSSITEWLSSEIKCAKGLLPAVLAGLEFELKVYENKRDSHSLAVPGPNRRFPGSLFSLY